MVDLNHINITLCNTTLNINGLNTPWDREHSTRKLENVLNWMIIKLHFIYTYICKWDKVKIVFGGKCMF